VQGRRGKAVWTTATIGGAILASGVLGLSPASAAPNPTIASLTFTATGGSLYYPEGIATNNNGTAYVSNTNDNVVASIVGSVDTTIAGSYEASGETGDGGPATSATLSSPGGLAVDAQGEIFIADTEDNVVREITTNGNIKLIAGNGTEGYSGNGGPAILAELDSPQAVAVDASGDVFIADTYNNVIREVTPNGQISTFAGNGTAGYSGDNGPATSAELCAPSGVAVDSLGNVYIADSCNNVIRRVSTTGIITTVAGDYALDQSDGGLGGFSGNGGPAISAQLNSPQGVALDQAGDLFIADTFNNSIREVTPDGTISSLVNTTAAKGNTNASTAAASTLSGPYAVAVDNSTGDVYIADTSNNKVKVVSGLGVPGPAAGGPVAPTPPPVLPESPLTVGLPIAALTAGALTVFGIRRRRRTSPVSA
jgi:sugar lactone lactonase YvrE